MATFTICDRCGKPVARGAAPYKVDVSSGTPARDVYEQSKRRIHCEVCYECAGKIVAFVRGGA